MQAGGLAIETTGKLLGNGTVSAPVTNNGAIEATGATLNITGAIAGPGQLVVDPGATLQLGGASAESVDLTGVGGALRLGTPASYTGTLIGFDPGDTLELVNTDATKATLVGTTLTVELAGGGTPLTYHLAAPAPGKIASLVKVGNNSDISLITLPPPVISAPNSENVFTGIAALVTPLSISDPNAGSDPLTIIITDANGTLSAKAAGAGTVNGAGTTSLTLTGSLADINAELASLTYTGVGPGSDSLQIQVTDAFRASASRSVPVAISTISFTNPIIHGPSSEPLISGMPTAVSGVVVSDPYADATGQRIVVDITSDLPVVFNAQGTGGFVLKQGTDHIQIVGTPSQINSYFADWLSDAISLAGLSSPVLKELFEVSQAKELAKVLNILTTIADEGSINEGELLGELIKLPNSSLAPPTAFMKVGVSAVAYGIASLISLIPGNGPAPSFDEFRDGLFKIYRANTSSSFSRPPANCLT